MKLIVGLGNPGREYEKTKHNIGFMMIDFIWNQLSADKMKKKFESEFGETVVNGEKFIFVKPQTFMNNSGISVRKWADFYQLTDEDIYIIYDDMDIPFSEVKLKAKGSSGGHNGMKSIIAHLRTEKFQRIRLGIGREPGANIVQYVLGNFSKKQLEILDKITFPEGFSIVEQISVKTFMELMNVYNQKKGQTHD